MKLFPLGYDINSPNFINRPNLLLTLFTKMNFLFYAAAFDIMKFENFKF